MSSENFTWGVFQEPVGHIIGLGQSPEEALEDASAQLGMAEYNRRIPRLSCHPITPELGDLVWNSDDPDGITHGWCGNDASGGRVIGTKPQATAWRNLMQGNHWTRKENLYQPATV